MTTSPAPEHRAQGPTEVACAVLTVSDTRTTKSDRGGPLVAQALHAAGHRVLQQSIIPDEPERIREEVLRIVASREVEVILLTGGTGISARDRTYDTLAPLLTRPMPGYGELLRMLSYEQIGPAAMLSRALGGLIDSTVVLTMPGSPAAVELAMQRIILPELSHLVQQASR